MPDELLEKLGNYFTHHQFYERDGITFEQFLHMWEIGTWEAWVA